MSSRGGETGQDHWTTKTFIPQGVGVLFWYFFGFFLVFFLVWGLQEGRKQGRKQQPGRIGRKEGGREERKEVRREGRKEGRKEGGRARKGPYFCSHLRWKHWQQRYFLLNPEPKPYGAKALNHLTP